MRVVIRLTGGTGNQLFGYALGRELSFRGHTVQYNIEDLKIETNRMYMLDKLGLQLDLTPDKPRVTIHETSHRFNEYFLNPKEDCYMVGYFQSEKYFPNVVNQIKRDLWTLGWTDEETFKSAADIRARLSCSIHVRRTDYIKNEWLHGNLDIPYYQKCIDYVMMDCSSIVHFYVFSDDPEWCRQHFTWDNMTVMDSKWCGTVTENNDVLRCEGGCEKDDLYLMSLCDYAIIANSSFSWWGAFLGKHKKVYAPANWFKSKQIDGSDVVPDRWLKVD